MQSQQNAHPARMSDLSGRLDPEVQAALLDAFVAVQKVSERLAAALERRAELIAAVSCERGSK